jgi:hypothetical protein
LYAVSYGTRFSSSNSAPQKLSWWEENHPQLFKNSVQANPLFENASSYDFSLQEGSPMIDAGAFLTQTNGSGNNSVTMAVEDAGWFMDGFGVVNADTIQIEGQTGYAIITSVDYSSNTLSLDRALTWDDGKGVSLKYVGAAPDIGAFEFGDAATSLDPSELQGKRVIPEAYTLANHPNPFNPSTQIFYSIPKAGYVSLIVFDSTGREVARLVTAYKPAGKYSYLWNAVNSAGRDLASNTYFVQLESGGYSVTHKITLLR